MYQYLASTEREQAITDKAPTDPQEFEFITEPASVQAFCDLFGKHPRDAPNHFKGTYGGRHVLCIQHEEVCYIYMRNR